MRRVKDTPEQRQQKLDKRRNRWPWLKTALIAAAATIVAAILIGGIAGFIPLF